MGLMWIPLAIGIQFFLLYALLGGPGRLLARFSGQSALLGVDSLGTLQLGLPIALLLAFPSLAALAAIEKWLHPVGWLDIVLTQATSLLLLLYRLRGPHPASIRAEVLSLDSLESSPTGESGYWHSQATPPAVALPSMPSLTTELPAPPPSANTPKPSAPSAADSIITPTPAAKYPSSEAEIEDGPLLSSLPIHEHRPTPNEKPLSGPTDPVKNTEEQKKTAPERTLPALDPRQLARELGKIYGWNRLGLERPFTEARGEPRTGIGVLPQERRDDLKHLAHQTLVSIRRDGGAALLAEFIADRLLEAGEYEGDVMRRLSLSVILGHDRLFIDPYDLEMCGEETVLAMYCLALTELGHESVRPVIH